MRFHIRFADQIVGALIVIAFLVLVAATVFIGRNQRWFARDFHYRAHFESAVGISPNMEVQYRGFPIGIVKGRHLSAEDLVEVEFTIFDTYGARVTEGSLVELQASPIGLGNRFLFHPGRGRNQLQEGSVIPRRGTPEAKELALQGLTSITESGDDVSILLSRAGSLVEHLNSIAGQLDSALAGNSDTAIGRIVGSVENTAAGLPGITGETQALLADLQRHLDPILRDLQTLTSQLSDPEGTVASLLDGEGSLNTGLESSLESVTGILRNLERTTEFLPAQLPQVAVIIAEARTLLQSVEGLLTALRNNPILRKGFPEDPRTGSGGTSARDVAF
jgi:phospholipid/cholesterol/gamma-HCH transport system substrate-binding protein